MAIPRINVRLAHQLQESFMNPAQMLRALKPKAAPEPRGDFLPLDWASAAGLTPYASIKDKRCPICGSKGSSELYLGTDQAVFFYCDMARNHIFEVDDDAGTVDRIDMGG